MKELTFEERIKMFRELMGNYVSPEFENWLVCNGFFTTPASTKYHGSYEGGLFDHSYTVTNTLLSLTTKNDLKWEKAESPYMVGMFHDLCKMDYYIKQKDGTFTTNPHPFLIGHGTKSVSLLSMFYGMSEEEIACITYHMGAFTKKEEWGGYTRAVTKYENVLWTHQADMIASYVFEV